MCMDTIYIEMFLAVSIIIIVCMGVWNINVLECRYMHVFLLWSITAISRIRPGNKYSCMICVVQRNHACFLNRTDYMD